MDYHQFTRKCDGMCDTCECPPPRPLNGIAATWHHDEGAYAQCGYCGRYSLDPQTLTDKAPTCACGETHGWSGSFKAPTMHAMWAGARPNVRGEAGQTAPPALDTETQ